MNPIYDVVIIGSGLGGLECATILSKYGYRVCVLEKNSKLGGTLHGFIPLLGTSGNKMFFRI